MPHSHGGPLLFPILASLFFSATWSGIVFGVRHLAVQPGTGGSSGIVHRNLSRPDLNGCTGLPVMVLSSFGGALKILGTSWVRLGASRVLILSGAVVDRLLLVHLPTW